MSETPDRSRAGRSVPLIHRIEGPAITAQALHNFREWRRDHRNASAFVKVEHMWDAAGAQLPA